MIFFSCTQSSPEIAFEKHALIFDFKNETATAEVKLAFFLKMQSEVRRVKKIELASLQNDCIWTIDNPIIFSEKNGEEWAGANNIVQHEAFDLSGEYRATFFDAHDEEVEKTFSVFFPNFLKNANAQEAKEKLLEDAKSMRAFFDEDGRVLFLGTTEDFEKQTNKRYAYFRDCLFAENIVCLLPIVENENAKRVNENENENLQNDESANEKKLADEKPNE